MKKVVIYPKDIMLLNGKSERYCRRLLQEIKVKLKKEQHQVVTLTELCLYLGVTLEEAKSVLK